MNCIVYLVRSSEDDLIDFNKSLSLLEKNLIPFIDNVDLVVFCEKSFEKFKSRVETQLDIKYQLIEFNLPDYPNGPVAWGHPGFSMGYRHMCRFFSGEMYKFDVIKNYDYYLRLDTDSFIHTPLNYDIFEWAKENECYYGFIAPAVQQDNEKVVEGLWDFVNQVYPNNIPDRLMFYTNFELGKVSWFLTSEYMNFYNYIDKSGGIYSRRWGDAPIKFLGINLFMNKQNIIPVQGFTYQHGAVYTV
jgi:hypothetical protein